MLLILRPIERAVDVVFIDVESDLNLRKQIFAGLLSEAELKIAFTGRIR